MRMLLKVTLPNEPFNTLVKAGTASARMKKRSMPPGPRPRTSPSLMGSVADTHRRSGGCFKDTRTGRAPGSLDSTHWLKFIP